MAWPAASDFLFDRSELVALLVGPDEHEMIAHKGYLSSNSEFFKAALKKEWLEGQTQKIKLPEEQPDIMAQYLGFAYGQKLPTDNTRDDCQCGEVYSVLTELYVLGERMLDSTIRNAIIKEILRFTTLQTEDGQEIYPGDIAICTIYDGTCESSPVRRLLVDLCVAAGSFQWLADTTHPVYLLELGQALLKEVTKMGGTAGSSRSCVLTADDYLLGVSYMPFCRVHLLC